jgi:hypothetical protein
MESRSGFFSPKNGWTTLIPERAAIGLSTAVLVDIFTTFSLKKM